MYSLLTLEWAPRDLCGRPGVAIFLYAQPHKTLCDEFRCHFGAQVRQIVDALKQWRRKGAGAYGRGFAAEVSP
jgi:hypothetical protein